MGLRVIEHDDIVGDLDRIEMTSGPSGARVAYVLGEHDLLTERFTTTRPHGRTFEGPAVITVIRWPDGGVDVTFVEGFPS
jgi:hypothetical protein